MVVVVLEVLEAGVAQPIQRKLNFTWDLLEMIRLICLFHILFWVSVSAAACLVSYPSSLMRDAQS